MALFLENLLLEQFRNYERFSLSCKNNIVILKGKNAVGKTNIIEAIQLLTALSSFRTSQANNLINNKFDFSKISADFSDNKRKNKVNLIIKNNKKTYTLNEKTRSLNSIKGMFPSVIFTPDDLSIIKQSNSKRRDVLDDIGCQISPQYRTIKQDFYTILSNKNRLLKEIADSSLINAINEIFILCSAQLTWYRAELLKKMSPHILSAYQTICGDSEELTCCYIPFWDIDNYQDISFKKPNKLKNLNSRDTVKKLTSELINNKKDEEIQAKRCLYGAQKDKILFFINKLNAQHFASQGQQRSIVLAFKMAEVSLIEEILNIQPILLFDDVMSELDEKRRNNLKNFFGNTLQVFITTTHLDYFSKNFLDSSQVENIM